MHQQTLVEPFHDVLDRDKFRDRNCGLCHYFSGNGPMGLCAMGYIQQHFGPDVHHLWCCDFYVRRDNRA